MSFTEWSNHLENKYRKLEVKQSNVLEWFLNHIGGFRISTRTHHLIHIFRMITFTSTNLY